MKSIFGKHYQKNLIFTRPLSLSGMAKCLIVAPAATFARTAGEIRAVLHMPEQQGEDVKALTDAFAIVQIQPGPEQPVFPPLVAPFHQGGVVQILETGGVQHAQVGGQLDHAQLLGQLVESPGGQPAAFLKRDPCVPDLRHVDEQGFVIP